MTDRAPDYEEMAFNFLADYHDGDSELIGGWRRNADRRWLITLQFVKSIYDGHYPGDGETSAQKEG